MNIRPVGFLDLSTFTSTFVKTYRERLKDDATYPGVQTLLLRSATSDGPILKEWKSARAILARLKSEAAPFVGNKPAVLGKAFVASLKPGSWVDWSYSDDAYSAAHLRLHICMIPSPFAFVFAGGEAANLAVGTVNYVNTQALHSEINVGPCARVHLIVDVKRPDDD